MNKGRHIRIIFRPGLHLLDCEVGADLGDLLALAARTGGDAQDQRICRLAGIALRNVDVSVISHRPVSLIKYHQ